MKTCLIILGGIRLGDEFHFIPVFNRIKNEGYTDITWVTGSYAKSVAECLAQIYGLKIEIRDDGFPQDINSRKNFIDRYKKDYDYSKYDYVFDNYRSSFEFEPNWKVDLKETYLPEVYTTKPKKDQIVVQADSTSSVKRVDGLFHVQWPYPIICVGGKDERKIPDSIDMMGKPWIDVINTICESKLYVGIHSAATCAAFYTATPLVVCDYGRNFDFTKYGHPGNIQLFDGPNTTQIQEAVNKLK